MVWLSVICSILLLLAVYLIVKIFLIKKDIAGIDREFNEKLKADTNTLITVDGKDKTVCRLAADINEQLKVLRKQRLKYEQGDLELKSAVANISHDLRTPLTAISGYLELLEKEQKSQDAERYIGIIKNRTETLKQLAEDLFRYSVITSPDYDSPKERLSVNSVLEECIAYHYNAFRQAKIIPEIHLPEITVYCNMNRVALNRIFSNLIENAIKYSNGDFCVELNDKGEITMSNMASELSTVEVSMLFDRFYTVENAKKSTGLGLSIVKILVEQVGGTIYAKYAAGKLITCICLPLAI
ncbi:HAMP domain-containing sensor histidine kinase [Anaerocaecibacter muris]|uniref:sensor histidine kinase n=1 Tax=Anaerocaecibacter muris TaxID=2941513 RepID=UPI00308421E7